MFSQFNWVDILILLICVRCAYVGLKSGFSWEIFKFIGLTFAMVLSLMKYKLLSNFLGAHSILPGHLTDLISLSFIFLASLLAFALLRLILARIIQVQVSERLDSLGGALLGFARGWVFSSLLLGVFIQFPIPYLKNSIEVRSASGKAVLRAAPLIYEMALKFFPKAASSISPKAAPIKTDTVSL